MTSDERVDLAKLIEEIRDRDGYWYDCDDEDMEPILLALRVLRVLRHDDFERISPQQDGSMWITIQPEELPRRSGTLDDVERLLGLAGKDDVAPTGGEGRRIVSAALRDPSTELIYSMPPPARHNTLINALGVKEVNGILRGISLGFDQGFVASDGRFVSREEAFGIAENAGQLIARHLEGELFSEDLW